MKFRLFIFTIFITEILSAQEIHLDSCKKFFGDELQIWTSSFTNFNLTEFKKSGLDSFDNDLEINFIYLKPFLEIYKPIITFTEDSIQFIDIYSYQLNLQKKGETYSANIEIDQAIFLCNLKTKDWNRIYFLGASGWIDEIIWISNTKFIMVGIEKDLKNNNKPVIYLGDTDKQILEVFRNRNNNCIQNLKGYRSPKLKGIKIKKDKR